MKKKINLLILLVITLCSSILFGQWEFIGLGGRGINTLRLSGNFIYAATDDGIYKKNITISDSIWIPIGLQGNEGKALLVINADTIFASVNISGMESDTVSLFLTIDGGTNWFPYQNGFGGGTGYNNQVLALQAIPNLQDTIYATGYAVVAKSTDFGLSWQNVWGEWTAGGMGTHFLQIDPVSPNIVWSGGESGYFQPYILKSIDYGIIWQENWIDVGGDNSCYCIAINPQDSDVVYVGMEGRVIKTTDGGDNWTTIFIPDNYLYFFGIAINPNNPSLIYASGLENWSGPQELVLFKSEDGGSSWSLIIEGEPGQKGVRDLQLVNNNNIDVLYFATVGSGVYKYTNVIVSIHDSEEIQYPTSFSLCKNYPNPFNLSTTISYNLTSEQTKDADTCPPGWIIIYNVKGQKVKQLKIDNCQSVSAGLKFSIEWDGTDENNQLVSSGIYFYQLKLNGKSEAVKKCLLLK